MTPSPQTASLQPGSIPTDRFMQQLIDFLLPFFLTVPNNQDGVPQVRSENAVEARAEILATLASYGPRTRQEFLHAAQIIAFGLSALDALSAAKAPDMSASMRLRCRGCANSLNRASQHNEKALARLQACDIPNADPAEPVNDLSDEKLREVLRQAQATIDTSLNRLSGARAVPHAGKTSAIFEALYQAAAPPRSAA